MDAMTVATIEEEKQRRGQAFMLAQQQLERQYNCTTTIVPRWEPGVSGTFVLGFDEQVMVGPALPEEKPPPDDA